MEIEIIAITKDVSLARLNDGMVSDIHLNSLDDSNRRFVPDEVFETIEITKEVVANLIASYEGKEGPFVLAIIRNTDHANMGYVQLVKIDEGWEVGYHVAEKYTGNGYATQAVLLFIELIRYYSKIKELYGVCLSDNLASKRVLEKCNFEPYFEGLGIYQGREAKIYKSLLKL